VYDIIGDIHGYCNTLEELLIKMGYSFNGKFWSHPERIAVFAGDFVDRGPCIRETVLLVKAMCENGAAYAIMGNHEYNAIAYFTNDANGKPIREHSPKNKSQFKQTLLSYEGHPKDLEEGLEWFKSLPLFMEFKDFRVIHACWDYNLINFIRNKYRARLTDDFLQKSSEKGTLEYLAIETLLKGKEVNLPGGKNSFYLDKDKNKRRRIRFKWWVEIDNHTYRDVAVNYEVQVPDKIVPDELFKGHTPYDKNDRPVFFGHYWKKGKPEILSKNICCVDYSIAKKDKLVAYRFNGEQKLNNENFISAECSVRDKENEKNKGFSK